MGRTDRRYAQKEKQAHMRNWFLVEKALTKVRAKAYEKLENNKDIPGLNIEKPELTLPMIFHGLLESPSSKLLHQATEDAISKIFVECMDEKKLEISEITPINEEYCEVLGVVATMHFCKPLIILFTLASMQDENERNIALGKIATLILTSKQLYEALLNNFLCTDGSPNLEEILSITPLIHWLDNITDNGFTSALKIDKELYEGTCEYLEACSSFENICSSEMYSISHENEDAIEYIAVRNHFYYLDGNMTELEYAVAIMRFFASAFEMGVDDGAINCTKTGADVSEEESKENTHSLADKLGLTLFGPEDTMESILERTKYSCGIFAMQLRSILTGEYAIASGAIRDRETAVKYKAENDKLNNKIESVTDLYRQLSKEKKSLSKQLEASNKEVDRLRKKADKLDQSKLNEELLRMTKESAERETELLSRISELQSKFDLEHKKRREIEGKAKEIASIATKQRERLAFLEEEQSQLETRESTIDTNIPIDIVVNYVRQQRLVIVGGATEILNSLKSLGLQFKQYQYNRKVETGAVAVCDCVIIMISNVKHPTFFSYRDTAKNAGKKIVYFRGQNTELLCRAIYHEMAGKG